MRDSPSLGRLRLSGETLSQGPREVGVAAMLCTFCLDEVAPCCHPSCPHGAIDPVVSLERLTPRTPTRPSLTGSAPTRIPIADQRPVPHIGTRPSLTRRPDER